jgi:uncharacterized protein YjbI with pentapeptide repeats
MNRQETHALFVRGKDAWNLWAHEMLSQRETLEKAKQWTAEREQSSGGELRGVNDPTRAWITAATADFSSRDAPHVFKKTADFRKWYFPGIVEFVDAVFEGDALFDDAIFLGDAWFNGAVFSGEGTFKGTTFSDCLLKRAVLAHQKALKSTPDVGYAWFAGATFSRYARFSEAKFQRNVGFDRVFFTSNAWFQSAHFSYNAWFREATYGGNTSYQKAVFERPPRFSAIHSERAFSLAKATFHGVPDFVQAHFAEAPRLDDSNLQHKLDQAREGDLSARYRALKRLAIQGHDHAREQDFFAGEIKSARFVTDWPLAWRVWNRTAWAGVARFWFGWLYQLTSDFGRSVVRPFAIWFVIIIIAAGYFLGQTQQITEERAAKSATGMAEKLKVYAQTSLAGWLRNQPCVAPTVPNIKPEQFVSGLTESVRKQTSAATEALYLALRNSAVILDGGADATHRTFGCLYGVERYGDDPVAIVPSNVAFASSLQKVLSALMIFLFGLAVRNMLRMK